MPVTVDSSAIVGGGSGSTGWSARSTFKVPRLGPAEAIGGGSAPSGQTGADTARAQSFTPTSNIDVSSIVLGVFKSGSPADNWYLEIWSNSGSSPSAVIGTSAVIGGADISGTDHWRTWSFSSPVSLTSGTKYWVALRRSGAVDASNYLNWHGSTTDRYASHGLASYNGSTWNTEGPSDFRFTIVTTAYDLYQVTQDTALHMWKSSDNGASWTELDNANAPAVSSSTRPFSADHTMAYNLNLLPQTPSVIGVAYFTNTNTVRVKTFSCLTDLWTDQINSADATTDASNERNVRLILNPFEEALFYTSVADDADLEYVRQATAGAWGAQTQTLALTSTEASVYADVVRDRGYDGTSRFMSMFWYDVTNDDFAVRTLSGTTLGTETDLDASAADVETEHTSAVYDVYNDSGTDKAIVAFIDADGTLEERVCSLGVTSASITQATQHQVSSSTSYLGRSLATCKYDGDLFIFAGTGSGIDVYKDDGATGTWGSVENWLTGLTTAVLSTAVPITGVGILVSYVDGGNTKVNLYVPSSVVPKTDSDSLDLTLTETESLVARPSDTDSIAVTLSESEIVTRINQRADSDPLTVTMTENNGVVTAATPDSDSLAITLAESEVVTHFLQKSDSDSIAVTASETDAVAAAITDTDSIAVTLSESEVVTRINQRADTDSLAITSTETDVVAAQIADSDSISVTLTEVEDVTGDITQKTDSDSLAVTTSEVESVTAQIADSDPLTVTLTESELVSRINQRADSDTLSITLAESESVTAAIAETDSLAITITESESVAKQSFKVDSDTLSITIVDTEAVSVAIVDTDEIVNITESELITAQITDLDSLANCGYGMEPYGDCGYGGESFLTESEIVSGYALGKNDSDTLDLTFTESESVYVVPRGTLDADLQIEQVLTGELSIRSPFFGVILFDKVQSYAEIVEGEGSAYGSGTYGEGAYGWEDPVDTEILHPVGELKGKVSVQSPMQSRMMVDKDRTAEVLYGNLVVT